MASVWDLSSDTNMANFQRHIGQLRLNGKRPKVEVLPEKRSLDQNSLVHALYREIAGQLEDQTVIEVQRECKLRHGVPILRVASEGFRAMYDKGLKKTLTYEEKLAAMDFLPVTRLFTKEQATEYIDTVIRYYSQQGICIVMPGEL